MYIMTKIWQAIPCSRKQINLDIALACGQSFRWNKTEDGSCWMGLIANYPYLLKQDKENIFFKILEKCTSKQEEKLRKGSRSYLKNGRISAVKSEEKTAVCEYECERPENDSPSVSVKYADEICKDEKYTVDSTIHGGHCDQDTTEDMLFHHQNIKSYLQLDVDIIALYKLWKKADENFKSICDNFEGVRMLRQDPVENLFSFICSQNNNISRITSLVEKLCTQFGDKVGQFDGKDLYSFPELKSLAAPGVEEKLRLLGFGYRAKFINQSASYILKNHSKQWLYDLRNMPYSAAHTALCKLPGVGAKVADCVCLMSLDKTEAVPVDTHVWQIACKSYLPHLRKYKSITDKVYQEIGDHFRSIFGQYAGWAHSVLFSADLRKFRDLHQTLPQEVTSTTSQKLKQVKLDGNVTKSEVSPSLPLQEHAVSRKRTTKVAKKTGKPKRSKKS